VQYKRAPITEAILEFKWRDPIDLDLAKRAARKLSRDYPGEEEQAQVATTITYIAGQDPGATVNVLWKGIKRTSADQAESVRVSTLAFTVLKLAPYNGWDAFLARAKRDWEVIAEVVGRRPIARIGLRYINRIDMPERDGHVKFSEYLTPLALPSTAWGDPSAYFVQLNFPPSTAGLALIVNTGTVVPPTVGYQSATLDIDVVAEKLNLLRDEPIWDLAGTMRGEKNRVFEACITDAARGIFNR
jgi:uncharacterized protein (TIGR04255 family)